MNKLSKLKALLIHITMVNRNQRRIESCVQNHTENPSERLESQAHHSNLWCDTQVYMLPMCLYALPTNRGHAPGDYAQIPGQSGVIHMLWYIMSHRFSIGFRAGDCEGQSVTLILSSFRNIHTLWPLMVKYCLEPSRRSDNFIPVPRSNQGTVGSPPRIWPPKPPNLSWSTINTCHVFSV